MAYSLETSSVKTIVPGAEISGFCDVVARQKINEVSGEVPQLSAGEGIAVTTVDGKTVITNNISAGSNISLVYDMETNTYRIDSTDTSADMYELSAGNGIGLVEDAINKITRIDVTGIDLSDYYQKTETSSKTELSDAFDYVSANAGHTYFGIAPIQVDNVNNQISITGESLSAGPGIDMFSSGGYVVISSNGGNPFPITGTNGTTAYTHGANCSSFYLSNSVSRDGSVISFYNNYLNFAAYPSTDVSASWYDIINAANSKNITCSAVKLTTAASETTFYTSALPNLNEITFIAPSHGPYQTYSALIADGETIFCAEVNSGCCVKAVRSWDNDRNKNCWFGLKQETYFYIG